MKQELCQFCVNYENKRVISIVWVMKIKELCPVNFSSHLCTFFQVLREIFKISLIFIDASPDALKINFFLQ